MTAKSVMTVERKMFAISRESLSERAKRHDTNSGRTFLLLDRTVNIPCMSGSGGARETPAVNPAVLHGERFGKTGVERVENL